MKRIAIIHTVIPVLQTFAAQLADQIPFKVKIHNLMDDFLASDPQELGYFSVANTNRLFNDLKSCELTGAELIITTCSTLSPIVHKLRHLFSVPIIAIDDAMCMEAVKSGSRITVLATAKSTIGPTVQSLEREAALQGKTISIVSSYDEDAYEAMKRGDLSTHNTAVLKRISQVKESDVIVLAQASMSHLAQEGMQIAGIPVLASTPLCQAQIVKLVQESV